MPRKVGKKISSSQEQMKRKLLIVSREIDNVIRVQWKFARQMLFFGLAAWVIGVATWVVGLVLFNSAAVSENILVLTSIGLVAGLPVLIVFIVLKTFSAKLKRFERVRNSVLADYEKMLIGQIKESEDKPEDILPK